MAVRSAFSSMFGAAVVTGSLAFSIPAFSSDKELRSHGPSWFRNCLAIPTEEGLWIQDCPRPYSDSGQYLVRRLYQNEQRRASGNRSYQAIERELRLYLK